MTIESRSRATLVAFASFMLAASVCPRVAHAQQTSRADSTSRDSVARAARQLERINVTAVRAAPSAPVSQTTLTASEIPARDFGIEVPLAVEQAPSLSAYAETSTYWGYSYLRLRGIDQSRINITLDGIPLNDPEDEVLYFADFPDLAASITSVQVQRGVGTSSNGTSSFAGALSLETTPLASATSDAHAELTAGSFGAERAMMSYASGLTPSGFAMAVRASALREDGYREHSGVAGRSAFGSVGWFGARDIVKLMATTGLLRDTLAYVGVSESGLSQDRRANPLRPDETDGFEESIVALSWSHQLAERDAWSTTAYKTRATGAYWVCVYQCDQPQGELQDYHLDFDWYGVSSAWSHTGDRIKLDAGVNANTYERNHYAYDASYAPPLLYFNTGHKRDASAFARGSYVLGRTTLFADVQGRWAEWHYTPDVNADIAPEGIDWRFLNPRVGATVAITESVSAFASLGANGREPARSDLLGGFDNMDTSNVASVGDLSRVRPEHVRDVESGVEWRASRGRLAADLFDMRFHDEILPIGQLTYIGTPLRQNVRASYRRGAEFEGEWRVTSRVTIGGNAAFTWARIAELTDEAGTGETYYGTTPLLTPRTISNQRVEWRATRSVTVRADGRYMSRSFLTNASDASLVLPSSYTLDGEIEWALGRVSLLARGGNLTGSTRYASGNVSGGEAEYYVFPPRNVLVTARIGL